LLEKMSERALRVLVAMSGGVDSSVAAARLVAEGLDVVGVTLHLWDYPDDGSVKGRCCAPEDVHDARRVSDALGIPHYAFDRRELFESEVIQPFVESYLAGETPSPCVRCNRGVKIKELMGLADKLGAAQVATGHYARIDRSSGRPRLVRARDRQKDQSYFLHMLDEATLSRLRFPLGDSEKDEVRAEAVKLDLPGAQKGESQELCFVPTGRYDAFVEKRARDRVRPGPILNAEGEVVGQHAGIHQFTVGQRKNLGVALGQRAYVTAIDPTSDTVSLGSRDDLRRSSVEVADLALADDAELPLSCEVAVRYRQTPVRAEVRQKGTRAEVCFEEPVGAASAGQFAVFYRGDRVLGGGVILRDGA
jgi:tRNA-specific 2-thiouridylase